MNQFASKRWLLIMVLSVFGCATGQWITLKNGGPVGASETRIDSLRCEREAATTYPFAQVITSSGGGGLDSSQTTCSGSGTFVNCNTSGGGYSSPTVSTSDGNAVRRASYYKSCMTALGYQRVFVKNTAVNAGQPSTNDRTAKYIVEAGGYCNESADCVHGLACSNHECVKPTAVQRPVGATAEKLTGPGGSCRGDESCRSGLICSDNRCVIDFSKAR
jgi:hypothetical protein